MKIWFISSRYYFLGLVPLAVLLAITLSTVIADSIPGKVIIIDAGHGGVDTGANRPGVVEKDINLAIALHVRDILQSQKIKVILTRETDRELSGLCEDDKVRGRYRRDLSARVEATKESAADLFVSIHANASSDAKRRGIECYYAAKSEESKKLAQSIEEQLGLIAPICQAAKPGDFFVLRRSRVPAVLIEVGFITNHEDRALLENQEYQGKLADTIVKGILQYYLADF